MRPYWATLNEQDRAAFRAATAFLDGRLEERATVDWGLKLERNDSVNRLAILELIDNQHERMLAEPWRSAWRLIEENWKSLPVEDHSGTGEYRVQRRLRSGDRSGSLITSIVQLVAPRLKVEAFSDLQLHYRKLPKRPKSISDLFSTGLTSGRITDPTVLKFSDESDAAFLRSLALALDSAVVAGLEIARQIGWDGDRPLWRVGQIHRVYFVPASERADGQHEPDEFHRGIAPSVKLLHAVISRLVDLGNSAGIEFVQKWKVTDSPIHQRLWAAMSRDSRVTSASEVGSMLLALDDRRFWSLNDYPEIAELRAKRFGEFEASVQAALMARIRKLPPRSQWPRNADTKQIKQGQHYSAVRELRRIEVAGSVLPERDKIWLDTTIPNFPELVQMSHLDEGFLDSRVVRFIPPKPDRLYDTLLGVDRLKALEAALASARRGWDDDPAERASDWIRENGNPDRVITDLEAVSDGGASFPKIWERFGWTHTPVSVAGQDGASRDIATECGRVLSLLVKLPQTTIHQAIDGISNWLSNWEKQVAVLPEALSIWLKIWPISVEATNAQQPVDEEPHLSSVAWSSDGSEPQDLDTLNTPAGKLVGVFLAMCPNLGKNDRPFDVDGAPRTMRDLIISTTGRSSLIARHRMIESLSYFLSADPSWTKEQLITPLVADTAEAIFLWRAIARRTQFSGVLSIIGDQMAERATDLRLGRETRRSIVFSLVIECLHAYRELRAPSVPFVRIQQMLRYLDDEVRAYAAEAVQRFVRDVSSPRQGGQPASTAEQLFRSAVVPFLKNVWPQERSLATPGVSKAFADLPATTKELFAEAVEAIDIFLVPFDCWSMIDYGLYGEDDDKPKLASINTQAKAIAFLRLLDLTIGMLEGSVIPNDLADALDQIRRVAPALDEYPVFRRLGTVARRG